MPAADLRMIAKSCLHFAGRRRTEADRNMADPRIIDIKLDERTILWRNADVEQERRIAIFDLLEDNMFAPQRVHPDGYAGPYKVVLRVEEGRLVIEITIAGRKFASGTPRRTSRTRSAVGNSSLMHGPRSTPTSR